jgi:hypothetical protein
MKNPRKILLFTLLGAILFMGSIILIKYYGGYWLDRRSSPWAYSRNADDKLLVGNWQGIYTDPDGVSKMLNITIIQPLTDAERWEKAYRFKKKQRNRNNYENRLRGTANVKSKLGLEEYTISGHVNKDDFHQIFIRFTPVDEKKRVLPNFTLFETTQSSWQADEVNLSLKFAYHKADGSSFWSSSIAKYSAVARCGLRRVGE